MVAMVRKSCSMQQVERERETVQKAKFIQRRWRERERFYS